MKTVSFVYPINLDHPIGGLKVIYDYANYLAAKKINVNIIYAAYFKPTDKSLKKRIKAVLKYFYSFYRRFTKCSWFQANSDIRETYVWELNASNIPQSDVYIATSANSATYVDQLDVPPQKKFYFIQHFANITCHHDIAIQPYNIIFINIVWGENSKPAL